MATISEMEKEFKDYLKEINAMREAVTLIQWDLRTKIPKKGVEQRSEVVGYLSQKIHQMQVSDKMKAFIDALKDNTEDEIIQKSILECLDTYEKNRKIPEDEYREYVMLQSKSEAVWQEARNKADFSLFQPYLEKLVAYNIKFANYWGYKENIYDALLNNYEPGVTVKTLDEVFPKVRKSLSDLLQKIQQSSVKPNTDLLTAHFPKQGSRSIFCRNIKSYGVRF